MAFRPRARLLARDVLPIDIHLPEHIEDRDVVPHDLEDYAMATTNEPPDALLDAVKSLNFRAGRDALAAFFVHAHKNRLGDDVEDLSHFFWRQG